MFFLLHALQTDLALSKTCEFQEATLEANACGWVSHSPFWKATLGVSESEALFEQINNESRFINMALLQLNIQLYRRIDPSI